MVTYIDKNQGDVCLRWTAVAAALMRSMLLLLLPQIWPYIFFCSITASSRSDIRSEMKKRKWVRVL